MSNTFAKFLNEGTAVLNENAAAKDLIQTFNVKWPGARGKFIAAAKKLGMKGATAGAYWQRNKAKANATDQSKAGQVGTGAGGDTGGFVAPTELEMNTDLAYWGSHKGDENTIKRFVAAYKYLRKYHMGIPVGPVDFAKDGSSAKVEFTVPGKDNVKFTLEATKRSLFISPSNSNEKVSLRKHFGAKEMHSAFRLTHASYGEEIDTEGRLANDFDFGAIESNDVTDTMKRIVRKIRQSYEHTFRVDNILTNRKGSDYYVIVDSRKFKGRSLRINVSNTDASMSFVGGAYSNSELQQKMNNSLPAGGVKGNGPERMAGFVLTAVNMWNQDLLTEELNAAVRGGEGGEGGETVVAAITGDDTSHDEVRTAYYQAADGVRSLDRLVSGLEKAGLGKEAQSLRDLQAMFTNNPTLKALGKKL